MRQIIDYFDDIGCSIDILTWHKTNPIPTCNNSYLSDTEYCVFARESGVKVYGSIKTKMKYYVTQTNIEDKKKFAHPTIKPLNIIENLIVNSSQENEVVFDCFMGSGTTAVAAKTLGRHYLGFELNPKFHKIALDRINDLTVEDRAKQDDGQMTIFD